MFQNIKWITIIFGIGMALIDVLVLGGLKAKSLGLINGLWILPIGIAVYAFQPIIFLKSLQFDSLTVMNLFWDLSSDVLVTMLGLYAFKEKLSPRRMLGVGLSLISLLLLSCD
jgi:hypothetical protein